MLLYQSTSNPWDTTFRNAEGQIIYKTENPIHPHSFTANHIAIKRILPSNSVDLATASEDALRDSFSDLAELNFGLFSASRIRYNGIEKDTSQFFRKANILSSGRIFTGPDGKEYEWKLRLVDCKLYLKDTKTLVACYHPRKFGAIGGTEASLEIFPEVGGYLSLMAKLCWQSEDVDTLYGISHRSNCEGSRLVGERM